MGEGGLETRHADRKAGRRHRLATETRDETIVPSAAADRTEADGTALLVIDLERELNLVDRAGIVFESADDRFVDAHTIVITCRAHQRSDFRKLRFPGACRGCSIRRIRLPRNRRDDPGDLGIRELGAFCEIATLVLAPFAEQHLYAIDAKPIEL